MLRVQPVSTVVGKGYAQAGTDQGILGPEGGLGGTQHSFAPFSWGISLDSGKPLLEGNVLPCRTGLFRSGPSFHEMYLR